MYADDTCVLLTSKNDEELIYTPFTALPIFDQNKMSPCFME